MISTKKSPVVMQDSYHGLVVDILTLEETMKMFYLYDHKAEKVFPVAYAIISENPRHCNLWFIYVNSQHRGKSYGRKLLEALLVKYGIIRTEYQQCTINEDGNKFCLACGFRMKKPLFSKDIGELILKKEYYHAKSG
ncbi:MAG: GNAT family N-acetyltransferase [bacterium]